MESCDSCTIKEGSYELYNGSTNVKELPEACKIHLDIKDEPELSAEKCVINILPSESCDKNIKCESCNESIDMEDEPVGSFNNHNGRKVDSLKKHLSECKNGIKSYRLRSHEKKMKILPNVKEAAINNRVQGLAKHTIEHGQVHKHPATMKAIEKGNKVRRTISEQDQMGILISSIEALNTTLETTNKNLEAVGKRFDSFMKEAKNDRSCMKDLLTLLVEKTTANVHDVPRKTAGVSPIWRTGNSIESFVLTSRENKTENLKSLSPATALVVDLSPVHTSDTQNTRTANKPQGLIQASAESSARLSSNLSCPTIAEHLDKRDTRGSVMDIVSERTKSCGQNFTNISWDRSCFASIEQESESNDNTLQGLEIQTFVDDSAELSLNETCTLELEENYINEEDIICSKMETQTTMKNSTELLPLVSSTISHMLPGRSLKRNSSYDLKESSTKIEEDSADMIFEDHPIESAVPLDSQATESGCEAGNENDEAEINKTETTEMNKSGDKSNFKSTKARYKKPRRPCPFCQKWIYHLNRHLLKAHEYENEIKFINSIKNQDQKLAELKKLRLKGIAIQNEKRRARGEKLISVKKCYEGQSKSMCLNCKGIYSRKCIYLHKRKCYKEQFPFRCGSIRVDMLNSKLENYKNNNLSEHYLDNIINKLRTDIIGTIIRKEPLLQQIGFEYYETMRQKKEMQHVRRSVLAHMRTICSVFYNLNRERRQRRRVEISFSDLFDVDMYEEIKRTIFRLSTKSDALENGQSSKVGSVERYDQSLKLSARALIFYYQRCKKYEEMNIVQTFYTHASMSSAKLTGESIKSKRNRRSRTSNYVLQQSDFDKVKQVIMETFTEFGNPSSKIDKCSYIKLRKAVLCRLTFFNGCCPAEVANLKITEWKLAKSNAHIPDELLKSLLEAEKTVFDSFKIANNRGWKRDADILIPKSCFNALNILCDSEIRRNAQIIIENPYIFASTNSPDAASGYHDIDYVLKEAQLPIKSCSIQLRHILSTDLRNLDCDTNLRKLCYDHLNPSAEISKSVSHVPKVREVLRNIGSILAQIENRISSQTDEVDAINKEIDCDKSFPLIEKEVEDKDVQDGDITVYRGKEKCSKNQPSVPNEDRLELRESDDSENKKKKSRFHVGWTEEDRIIIQANFQGFIEGSKLYPNPREVDKFFRRNKNFLDHIKSNSEKQKRLRIQLQNYKKRARKIKK